ncbi:tripartite tricarboxylate transporter TctB family protein [Sediminispirochaeta bajacaliforniensis]|uniref:tripartite tricarboxylate transporter TctB family protein n=1 Tax=Sediminispirochaeta bajacaliforniensis TaxID=148 RepID=UPI0003775F80|nr:tripartite tricarboxylate transporter TctB family protein [Sediminispirochaeta bajacaliforniensis]
MDLVISVIIIAISAFWIDQGITRYGFWPDGIPGGGFIPVLFGIVALIASVAVVALRKRKHEQPAPVDYTAFIPIGAGVVGIVFIQTLGISLAVFFLMFLWMKFLSKYSFLKSIGVSLAFTLFIFGVFRVWLRVPFPSGLFHLM